MPFHRLLPVVLVAFLSTATAATNRTQTNTKLVQLQQQRNQLILQQNTGQGIQFGQQRAVLQAQKPALSQRNTGYVTITEDAVFVDGERMADHDPAVVRERYGLPEQGFVIVVVDRQGEELLRSRSAVDAQRLLKAIDGH